MISVVLSARQTVEAVIPDRSQPVSSEGLCHPIDEPDKMDGLAVQCLQKPHVSGSASPELCACNTASVAVPASLATIASNCVSTDDLALMG